MRKWIAWIMLTLFGLTSAFGQLKVTNNFGADLNISVNNGKKELVPNKGTKTFGNVRGRSVWLECQTLDGKTKFNVEKNPSRSGVVWLEPGDAPSIATSQTVSATTYSQQPSQTPAQSVPAGTSLQSLLKQKTSTATPAKQTPAPPSVAEVQRTTPTPTYTAPATVSVPTAPAREVVLDSIKVIYNAKERCKIFSDIGGSSWQGLEFRGKQAIDSIKDNAKNEYDLQIKKDRDLHIGVIFNPEGAINEYGEFRKRVNKDDKEVYINDGDIKKMSTSEKKSISIRYMGNKGSKIYFDPEDTNSKGQKEPISLEYKQQSRRFMTPIGQFYVKVSYTDANGMFHPTVYVPVHVTNRSDVVIITAEQVNKALGADLNLDWSKLRGQ